MAGGTQTTSQNSTSEPWAAAQPALKQSIGGAQNLASAGAFQPNTMSMVTPYANQTNFGLQGLEGVAMDNRVGRGTENQYREIIGNQGYNQQQQAALQPMQAVARGDYLNRTDPNFERALGAASESAANQINLGASGAGRYGGAIHQGNVAREIGNYEAGQRVNQYNTERGNQMAAASGLFNAGQQGFSNLGSAYQGMMTPYKDLINVGSYGEDLNARMLNDQARIFEAQQAAPRQNVEWLNAIASGAGSLGGSSTATAERPGQSPFATALGYGTGLASLFGG
jgi:hypothetical protein